MLELHFQLKGHEGGDDAVRVDNHIDIDRSAADVFAYVSDQLNAPLWQSGLIKVTRSTPGPIGVGTRHTFVRRVAGRRILGDNEYHEFDPGHKVAFKFGSESMAGTGSYEVEPLSPGRTRLHTSVEIHPRGLARLAEPLISRSIKKEDNVDLASLKELLEQADHTLT
ncbi:MAG: SRPBCC family protein [Acidimicrobiia bacterium]